MAKSKEATSIPQHRQSSQVSLVAPEVILPLQYDLLFARHDRLTPQQRLMLAVLENAVHDVQRYQYTNRKRERQFFREALEWFTIPGDKGAFSFVAVCQNLGLEPNYIRRGLLASFTFPHE